MNRSEQEYLEDKYINDEEYLGEMPSTALHETKDYEVQKGVMTGGDWKGRYGYLVVNKRTEVVEGELSVEAGAINTIMELQELLDAALARQSGEQVTKSEAPVDVEDLMKRLKDKFGEEPPE